MIQKVRHSFRLEFSLCHESFFCSDDELVVLMLRPLSHHGTRLFETTVTTYNREVNTEYGYGPTQVR